MSDDLGKIPWAIRLSRQTLGIIKQNIAFALGLKIIFLTLGALGMATLWMAVFVDMGGSLIVIANALRLLKFR
jgi:Cd2+/Zn2+-exporting ATPase